MPLDHIAIYVHEAGLDKLAQWLTEAGEPLGLKELARPMPFLVALGEDKPWFWLSADSEMQKELPSGWHHAHLGFAAESAEAVDKWHAAAIKAGGTDNGKPGPRPMFGPSYYAAFVKDPVLGINFEAVCKTWNSPSENIEKQPEEGNEHEAEATSTEAGDSLKEGNAADEDLEQPSRKRARQDIEFFDDRGR